MLQSFVSLLMFVIVFNLSCMDISKKDELIIKEEQEFVTKKIELKSKLSGLDKQLDELRKSKAIGFGALCKERDEVENEYYAVVREHKAWSEKAQNAGLLGSVSQKNSVPKKLSKKEIESELVKLEQQQKEIQQMSHELDRQQAYKYIRDQRTILENELKALSLP